MRIYFLKLQELMGIKQEGGETLDGFRKRIRVAINNLRLAGGDGVIQPNMTGTGLDNQPTFGERLLVYEQQDEDGFDSAFPKKVGHA
eukprot:13527162-Ditylum_brightwellii.AAC.1